MASVNKSKERYKVAIISPTPFYYHVELYRQLAAHPRIELMVYFCSREALDGTDVRKAYGTLGDWGVERMLEGYNYKFLKNYTPRPTYFDWPFGLVNLDVWNEIKRQKPDAVILQAWTNMTWWLAMFAAWRFKVPIFLMTDANPLNEPSKTRWKKLIRKIFLGILLFRISTGFLYSGEANKELYQMYGVPNDKLFPFRYSWGYTPVLRIARELKPQQRQIREHLGIPQDAFVILFSGRLSDEKQPLHLLEAYSRLESKTKAIAFVGDGTLSDVMKHYVEERQLERVYFFGFHRRDEIWKFYAAADLLILPSAAETWGMVVNEAMCFSLPIITSDKVGAATDLIQHEKNGFVFPVGDVETLVKCIRHILDLPETDRLAMGAKSLEIIQQWSDFKPDEALLEALDIVLKSKSE